MTPKTFDRGIHPAYHKELTFSLATEKAPLPKRVVIPLGQHVGAPCRPVVKKGDIVEAGQLIGEAVSFVSAPVHASIGGKVKEVAPHPHPGGGRMMAVVIDGDGTDREWSGGADADLDSMDPDQLRKRIREAGIVGMGGAAFPTAVKLSPPQGKVVDTVILNGCECEPYLSADHRLMLEEPEKVLSGLKLIMRATGAKDGCVALEDNKLDALEALRKAAEAMAPEVRFATLKTKYPQGAEKILIYTVLGRKVPLGKLPFDAGVVVNNVGTAVAIYEALGHGKPLIERVLTVSGNGVATPKNLKVRIGTSFAEVLALCGGITEAEGLEREVLNGGPMMGVAQTSLDVPVVKGTSGITVLEAREIKPAEFGPCIRCARCVETCPMGLMPYRIADMGRLSLTSRFKGWDGVSCIECGCCAFICPPKRPLVQWIRVGKIKLREAEQEASA
ncbi:MAG: electron transport complex subunit RsxC [Thermodesulfobacteriota bacterium]